MKILVLAAGLALGLAGCATQMSEVYTDPSFTPDSLRRERLAIGGIVSLAGSDDPEQRARRDDVLRGSLKERRADLVLPAPGEVPIALGLEELQVLLDAYRLSGRFTPDQMRELHRARPLARYVIFGRIDLDVVVADHERSEETVAGRVRYLIEPVTRREVGITFDVMDLQEQRLVWSAYLRRVDQTRGDRLSYEPFEGEDTEAEIVRAIAEMLRNEGGPEPPPTEQVLNTLCRDLARALPGRAD